MPSRSQKSKERAEREVENVDSNSTHAGLKRKRETKRGDGNVQVHASTTAPKAKSIQCSLSTIYSSEGEDDANPSHTASNPDSPLDLKWRRCTPRHAGC